MPVEPAQNFIRGAVIQPDGTTINIPLNWGHDQWVDQYGYSSKEQRRMLRVVMSLGDPPILYGNMTGDGHPTARQLKALKDLGIEQGAVTVYTYPDQSGMMKGKRRLYDPCNEARRFPAVPLAVLCEQIALDGGSPQEAVPFEDAAPQTDAVNLYGVSDEDWEDLSRVQNGDTDIGAESLAWLKECGLLTDEGGTLRLSRLAEEWLSQPIGPETQPAPASQA